MQTVQPVHVAYNVVLLQKTRTIWFEQCTEQH